VKERKKERGAVAKVRKGKGDIHLKIIMKSDVP
jgi:hypothetical protein